MPDKNGKPDTQRTEQGYEIPVPKRDAVFAVFDKAAKKKGRGREGSRSRTRKKPSKPS